MNLINSQSFLILFEHFIDWQEQHGQQTVEIQKKVKVMIKVESYK